MTRDFAKLRMRWNYPTDVRFGAGSVADLPAACQELTIERPLLVCDKGLADLAITSLALDLMRQAGRTASLFSGVRANPQGADVEAGVLVYRRQGCDGVVAFGGGSALDAAKTIALMTGQSRPLWDFEDREDWFTRVDVAGMAPVVAVPTTAGTGSEVGRSALIVDGETHSKKIIFHPRMLPGRVICDPELTIGLPAAITAAVGMDALSHNLEAFCSPNFHPQADGIALEGMRLIRRSLLTAYEDGSDLAARSEMLAAATMGATAFQKGLGAMHAIGHALGGLLDTGHGLTMAVLMPYVLAFNRDCIAGRLGRAAAYLELAESSFDAFFAWVLGLRSALGIPMTIAELGVTGAHVPDLVARALQDPTAGTNPRPLGQGEIEDLLGRAMEGRLEI